MQSNSYCQSRADAVCNWETWIYRVVARERARARAHIQVSTNSTLVDKTKNNQQQKKVHIVQFEYTIATVCSDDGCVYMGLYCIIPSSTFTLHIQTLLRKDYVNGESFRILFANAVRRALVSSIVCVRVRSRDRLFVCIPRTVWHNHQSRIWIRCRRNGCTIWWWETIIAITRNTQKNSDFM